ncbi:nitrate reductase cytochrome c-type subunit [Billgrantia azerbaijanica]|nr:nitrate reductase cytochrome c-type subunit [Halomonas azerbaijanica]
MKATAGWSGLLLIVVSLMASLAWAGGMDSLRQAKPLDAGDLPPQVHRFEEGDRYARDYVQQPPLVPHEVERYQIDTRANRCLSCHSWANYRQEMAPKVSRTHFQGRDGQDQANISARYYFCNQCHVPQTDARPLIDNHFQPLRTLHAD